MVMPVPNVTIHQTISNFHSISVTPSLSHLTKKLLVYHWTRLAFADMDILDQYAINPTGSTSCAQIYCIDEIKKILETNN